MKFDTHTIMYSEFIHRLHDVFTRWKYLIPFIGYPLRAKENYRPFFIIGSGRSGNTLLRRILNSHESLFIPPETYVLGKVMKSFRQNRNMNWRNLVYLILSQFEFHKEFSTFNISLRPLAQELIKAPKCQRSLAFIINSFYHFYAKENMLSGLRWGDKTPVNTYFPHRIYSVFPRAQFIHMVRDGCDVVSSYLKSGIYSDIEKAARRWLLSLDLACKFGKRHPKNYIEIRYEDLVQNPKGNVKKVCNFLEIHYDPKMLYYENSAQLLGDVSKRKHHSNVMKPIFTNSIGKGRSSFNEEEKKKLQEIIGKRLKLLGYEPLI